MRQFSNKFLIFLLWIMEIRLSSSIPDKVFCYSIASLTYPQKRICAKNVLLFFTLRNGILMGQQECEEQFKGHKWNCTNAWRNEVLGHFMFLGSRETAFVYAIASAGATYSIANACRMGVLNSCGCITQYRKTSQYKFWKWGGCSDELNYAMKYTKKFLNAKELENDLRTRMNLINNRAGRNIVKSLTKKKCMCHGVSRSCLLKTCWQVLPPFSQVGEGLMMKYKKAKLVRGQAGKKVLSVKQSSLKALNRKIKPLDLVYIEQSPNYCIHNERLGSPGTHGRVCIQNGTGINSCHHLCCGRGANINPVHRVEKCNCKFEWCCDVKCDTCESYDEEYTCK